MGVIDIWLSVIRELKKSHSVSVVFVFPDPSALRLVDEDSDLFALGERFSDEIIFRTYSGRWAISESMTFGSKVNKLNRLSLSLHNLERRLLRGRLSTFRLFSLMGRVLHRVLVFLFRLSELLKLIRFVDIGVCCNGVDGILYDVTVEEKPVNQEFLVAASNIPKFSMMHGLGALWTKATLECNKKSLERKDVTVYVSSELERKGYNRCFGVPDENIVHAGIPRHDRDWIEYVCGNSCRVDEHGFDNYVFIIGRPASRYLPPKRKAESLRVIYDVLVRQHKFTLVVKAHPKEDLIGLDGEIYNNALGSSNYKIDWMYSKSHPFVLGKGAMFCVSFYSGVINDMLALNKPTIEYLDLRDIPDYDNSESLRDDNGDPVLSERKAGLVLGVNDKEGFIRNVDKIINKREFVISSLTDVYNNYYGVNGGLSAYVSDDIVRRIQLPLV